MPYLAMPGSLCSTEMNVDRKSTRLNSSHVRISYAVFCLKKKQERDVPQVRARLTDKPAAPAQLLEVRSRRGGGSRTSRRRGSKHDTHLRRRQSHADGGAI